MAAYEVRRKQATQPHIPAVFDGPPRPKPAPGEIVNNGGIHAGIRPQPVAAPLSSLGDWMASKNLEAARKEMTACWEMLSREDIPEHDEREWFTLSQRLASFIKRTSEEIALLKKANQAIDGAREKAEKEAHALRQQLRQVRIAAGEEPKAS